MKINTKFSIGENIVLKTDIEKRSRMITNIKICPNDNLIYYAVCGDKISEHYEIEIQADETLKQRSAGFITEEKK